MSTGLSQSAVAACTFCMVAVNLKEWLGTTRSSWSAVVTSIAG
jgi:hypothetical protein